MVKKVIVAGNWKLYVDEPAKAKKLTAALKRKVFRYPATDIVLLPTATLLPVVASAAAKSSLSVGVQATSAFDEGAYTGYISARAAKNAGASWALVGHSERRAQQIGELQAAAEGEETIQREVQAAHRAGLKVMLCVGERERDPSGSHFSVIERQLSSALSGLSNPNKLAIAYEPVWAIGKSASEAMKSAELQETVIFIRRTLTELFDRTAAVKVPILYGGSVDGSNARELLMHGGVSGFLVGRASADTAPFVQILDECK